MKYIHFEAYQCLLHWRLWIIKFLCSYNMYVNARALVYHYLFEIVGLLQTILACVREVSLSVDMQLSKTSQVLSLNGSAEID